jgi:hypothetical protein
MLFSSIINSLKITANSKQQKEQQERKKIGFNSDDKE